MNPETRWGTCYVNLLNAKSVSAQARGLTVCLDTQHGEAKSIFFSTVTLKQPFVASDFFTVTHTMILAVRIDSEGYRNMH